MRVFGHHHERPEMESVDTPGLIERLEKPSRRKGPGEKQLPPEAGEPQVVNVIRIIPTLATLWWFP